MLREKHGFKRKNINIEKYQIPVGEWRGGGEKVKHEGQSVQFGQSEAVG